MEEPQVVEINDDRLSAISQMSHEFHVVYGDAMKTYGDVEVNLIEKVLGVAEKIAQTIGIFAGFGFTAISEVKNIYFFLSGEIFLIAAILFGINRVKSAWVSNLESVQTSSNELHAIMQEKSEFFQNSITSFVAEGKMNVTEFQQKLNEIDSRLLGFFKRDKKNKKKDEGKFLKYLIIAAAIGAILLLFSFTNLSKLNFITDVHSTQQNNTTQKTNALKTVASNSAQQKNKIINPSPAPTKRVDVVNTSEINHLISSLDPLQRLNDPWWKQPDFLGAVVGAFFAIAAAIIAVILTYILNKRHERNLKKTDLQILEIKSNEQGTKGNYYIYRLVIKNNSDNPATTVEVDTDEIYDYESSNPRGNFLPAPLGWTHMPDPALPRDIQPGQTVFLDICEYSKGHKDIGQYVNATLNLSIQRGKEVSSYLKIDQGKTRVIAKLFQSSGQTIPITINIDWDGENPPDISL